MTAGLARQGRAVAHKDQASEERLAAALRENLLRRKAQARELGAETKNNED